MDKSTRPLVLTWIALAKALLVAIVFMRLRRAPALLRLAAVAGAVTLVLLVGLSLSDYTTRTALKAPWQQPATVSPRLGSR